MFSKSGLRIRNQLVKDPGQVDPIGEENTLNRTSILLALCAAAAGTSGAATWFVSGSGSDSNLCTATSPCRTFAGALAVMNQQENAGTIIALDSSDFSNGSTLNINGAIIIDGGGHGAFLSGPSYTSVIAIQAGAGIMTIRNLTIIAGGGTGGTGISGTLGPQQALNLDKVAITALMNNNGSGVYLQLASTASANLTNVTVNQAASCLQFLPAFDGPIIKGQSPAPYSISLQNVVTDGCNEGGLVVQDGNATIRDSTFRGSNIGIQFVAPSQTLNSLIEHTELVNNGVGLSADVQYTVRLSNSVVSNNLTGVTGAGTFISFRNNVFAGNGADGTLSLSTSLK
jgi:hypothetical protein